MLFVGAHPDDEAFALSTYGQWGEYDDVRTGVITITRGEGGGNAVGPEEGPALGLIREAEERRAVARAGITDVYNLDEVDFFYTVSAALTEQVWGHDSTLRKVVRVVRETTPEVIVTMDPAPSPGNHGNHQYAGRMALEAFHAAADPTAFPRQLGAEGLRTWAADKVLLGSARGTATGTGPDCPTAVRPERPTQDIYGVWDGTESERWDDTWAQVERESQREYASQGWAVFPDVPDRPRPARLRLLHPGRRAGAVRARRPRRRHDRPDHRAAGLAGPRRPAACRSAPGSSVDADPFSVAPGATTTLTVRRRAPQDRALGRARLDGAALRPAGRSSVTDRSAGSARASGWCAQVTAHGTRRRRDQPAGSGLGDPARAAALRLVVVRARRRAAGAAAPSSCCRRCASSRRGPSTTATRSSRASWSRCCRWPPAAAAGWRVQVTNKDSGAARRRVSLDLPDGFARRAGVAAVPATRRRRRAPASRSG